GKPSLLRRPRDLPQRTSRPRGDLPPSHLGDGYGGGPRGSPKERSGEQASQSTEPDGHLHARSASWRCRGGAPSRRRCPRGRGLREQKKRVTRIILAPQTAAAHASG